MEKITGKYIGLKKVKEVKLLDRKTYLGGNVVEVIYDDDTKEEFTQEMAEKIATEKTTDLTTLRDNFVKSVVEKMIVVLLEAEIQIVDIEFALAQVSNSLNMHLEKASEILWGKDLMKRNLADIQKILTSQQKNELQTNNQRSKRRRIPKNISDKKRSRKVAEKEKPE